MIFAIIIALIFLSLVLKIVFSLSGNTNLKFFFTPLTTIFVIVFVLFNLSEDYSRYAILITLALIFSLAGDIFNMYENGDQKNLQFGMIFFLFTHAIYIYCFSLNYSFSYYQIFIIVMIAIILLFTFFLFRNNFRTNVIKILSGPYMIAVSLTLLMAAGNLATKINERSILITAGALLFWLSDLIVGVDAFYKKIKFDVIFVWGLYIPGQFLIALSCYY